MRSTPADGLARAERFIKEFKGDALIVPAVAPHALYTNDEATLKAAAALARRYDVPLIIHLAETEDEVKIAREQHQATPSGLSRVDRVLGTADARRPWRVGERRRTCRFSSGAASACRTTPRAT